MTTKPTPAPALIDTAEAATILGVTPGMVTYLVRTRQLNARRLGSGYVYDRADVEALAARRAAS